MHGQQHRYLEIYAVSSLGFDSVMPTYVLLCKPCLILLCYKLQGKLWLRLNLRNRIRKPARPRENSFLRQFPIFHELHSRVTQNNNFCVSFDLLRLQKQKKKRDSSHTFFYFPLGYKMVSKILPKYRLLFSISCYSVSIHSVWKLSINVSFYNVFCRPNKQE